ncbi:MAG: response regulator transcription factor [Pseudomonadota bacterium]|nr:response regulator transcription factor [Pseudomonadota bacterium]MEC8664403.1 response regulator transcription factor [Pseudomonadota bacterium]
MKVLTADNNPETLDFLGEILRKEGFTILTAESGSEALAVYEKESPDFICLDIMMPDQNGYDVCREIRRSNTEIPIIFISSKSEPVDKILGLELGADDYITKPFDIGEVMARIRAVARRCISRKKPETVNESFKMGPIEVFPNQLRAYKGEQVIDLSLREVKILTILYDKKNNVVTRDDLLDYCWGAHIMAESRTVDWHISQLRKSIEDDPKNPLLIKTVHGVGYKYEEDAA